MQSSDVRKAEYIHMYIYIYMYTDICVYIYIYVYLSVVLGGQAGGGHCGIAVSERA